MFHDILFLLMGLALLIAGGNYLTDGATSVARRFGISELVIGLTVVALGSSTPDMVVCITSTLQGKSQMALGDVVGANIFDILLVVGIVALVKPIRITPATLKVDLPMMALSSLVLFFCGDDRLIDGSTANIITRTDGLMMLAFFAIFMAYTVGMAHTPALNPSSVSSVPSHSGGAPAPAAPEALPAWRVVLYILGGLAALVLGGQWVVSGASGIALRIGMSEAMVGLTIVAVGSSLPDLSTSLIAAVKNRPGIALGNVVGSCVFNVFFNLGVCATLRPLDAGTISFLDFGTLAVGALLVWLFGRFIGTRVITRAEGAVLTLAYVAYMTFLVVSGIHH